MLMSYQHHQSAYPTAFTATSDVQRVRESRMTAPLRATRPSASEDAAHEFVYSDNANNTSDQDGIDLQFQHAYHHYDQQVRDPQPHHHAPSSGGARLYPSISGSYASGSFEYVQQQPVAPVAQGSMLYGSSHAHTNWASVNSYTSHHVDTTAPSAATTSTTLSGLPELRTDFHESDTMFSGTDEYNDAKILHEVLQDNQQLPHHERHSLSLGGGSSSSNNSGFASLPHQYQSQYNSSVMASYPHSSASPINMSDLLLPPLTTSFSGNNNSYSQPTSTSPSSSSYVSSSAGSPVSSLSSSGHHGHHSHSHSMKKKPASRICRMPGCSKGIRSRGLCKGHGGGRRCLTPGCEISDQGGGHCIAHGGGKRCTVAGCQKSAQSKGLCKLHGGARRCKVPNCAKNCQVKGLCRLHYSMYAASSNPMATASSSSASPANSPSKFAFASHTLDLQTTYIRSQ